MSSFFLIAKEKTVGAATKVGEVAKNTTQTLNDAVKQKDWRKEKEAWNHLREGTSKTITSVSTQAAAGGQYLARQASATAKRIGIAGAGTLEARCKHETSTTPCPRMLLVCCNYIVSGNLQQAGIFKDEGPEDLLEMLYGLMEKGNCVVLIPRGTSLTTTAAVVKRYLHLLSEPLLTFRLGPDFISAGTAVPSIATSLLQQLPSANYNSLVLLLDCLKRVAEQSEANGMTARKLAEELAPCVLWHPLPKDVRETESLNGNVAGPLETQLLSQQELNAVANVLEHFINSS
mmetsp:Transcript_24829/g.69200  ORF Transcript_24829/g.69200 Transcript_24829/m.69200 type:complete len:289 (-) Transcript_24829:513-1379(-)